jgi:hypothetical protein
LHLAFACRGGSLAVNDQFPTTVDFLPGEVVVVLDASQRR